MTPEPVRLALFVAASLVVAALVTVCAVLPAEYGRDPTGFGKMVGLDRLYSPPEQVIETRLTAPPDVLAQGAGTISRQVIQLEIGGITENRGEIEYKVTMEQGDVLMYRITASAPLYFDFHGHSQAPLVKVMNYHSAEVAAAEGILVAPLTGIHGWYFRNGGFTPITVEIELIGQYRLEPGRLEL